jgi:hypothetical protein
MTNNLQNSITPYTSGGLIVSEVNDLDGQSLLYFFGVTSLTLQNIPQLEFVLCFDYYFDTDLDVNVAYSSTITAPILLTTLDISCSVCFLNSTGVTVSSHEC